jgi:hypothetical protein
LISPPFTTYEQIVRDYIETARVDTGEDLAFYASMRSLREAVENAARGATKDGSRHRHYYRRRHDAMRQFGNELVSALPKLKRAKNFEELHRLVESIGLPIRDIGDLTVYDTAERIGATLGLEPERVYLHCGTKVGARHLGFTRRKTLALSDLPKAFQKLLPREAEDCLCGYRDHIKRIAAGEV